MSMDLDAIFRPALELLERGVLLCDAQARTTATATWQRVRDLQQAQALAWHADDSVENVWNDLREQQAAYIVFDGEKQAWDHWESTLSPQFDGFLADRGWEDLSDDVVGDLYYICCNRYFQCGHTLWDQMLDVYRAGGWPCGWVDGEFPQGRLAVFLPTRGG